MFLLKLLKSIKRSIKGLVEYYAHVTAEITAGHMRREVLNLYNYSAWKAMESSYNYAQSNMQDALLSRKSERLDKKEHMNMFMLSHAVDRIAIKDGCALEFGVYEGATLRHIAKIIKQNVHGFDSFVGLPESGGGTYWGKGMFDLQGRMPEVPSHVKLHKGWFEDTIPVFLNEHKEDIALLHLDPDLYSSHIFA